MKVQFLNFVPNTEIKLIELSFKFWYISGNANLAKFIQIYAYRRGDGLFRKFAGSS